MVQNDTLGGKEWETRDINGAIKQVAHGRVTFLENRAGASEAARLTSVADPRVPRDCFKLSSLGEAKLSQVWVWRPRASHKRLYVGLVFDSIAVFGQRVIHSPPSGRLN